MRPTTLALVMLLLGCPGPDFRGKRGLGFGSTLSRQFVKWTPKTPVAEGSAATFFWVDNSGCLLNCPPPPVFRTSVSGPSLAEVPPSSRYYRVLARQPGSGTVAFVAEDGGGDSFDVRVARAEHLSLTDPVLFNRPVYPQYLGFDGGTWPDVGEQIVMGPHGKLYLEVLAHTDAGQALGFEASALSVRLLGEPGPGWAAEGAGHQVDLHAAESGTATLEVGFADAGLRRTWEVRVAGPEEAQSLELLVQPVAPLTWVFKASVLTTDGGPLLEPELTWVPDPGFHDSHLWSLTRLRPRRDIRLLDFSADDAGTYDAAVRVHFGALSAHVDLRPVVPPRPPPAPPPPPPARGCSTPGGAEPLLGLLWLWAARSLRRAPHPGRG